MHGTFTETFKRKPKKWLILVSFEPRIDNYVMQMAGESIIQ